MEKITYSKSQPTKVCDVSKNTHSMYYQEQSNEMPKMKDTADTLCEIFQWIKRTCISCKDFACSHLFENWIPNGSISNFSLERHRSRLKKFTCGRRRKKIRPVLLRETYHLDVFITYIAAELVSSREHPQKCAGFSAIFTSAN